MAVLPWVGRPAWSGIHNSATCTGMTLVTAGIRFSAQGLSSVRRICLTEHQGPGKHTWFCSRAKRSAAGCTEAEEIGGVAEQSPESFRLATDASDHLAWKAGH
jgi:hypothetical protein